MNAVTIAAPGFPPATAASPRAQTFAVNIAIIEKTCAKHRDRDRNLVPGGTRKKSRERKVGADEAGLLTHRALLMD